LNPNDALRKSDHIVPVSHAEVLALSCGLEENDLGVICMSLRLDLPDWTPTNIVLSEVNACRLHRRLGKLLKRLETLKPSKEG
jgi:hypothetical protein